MVPYRAVHATRGKVARAEPVAALYEQGRISHRASFARARGADGGDDGPRLRRAGQPGPGRCLGLGDRRSDARAGGEVALATHPQALKPSRRADRFRICTHGHRREARAAGAWLRRVSGLPETWPPPAQRSRRLRGTRAGRAELRPSLAGPFSRSRLHGLADFPRAQAPASEAKASAARAGGGVPGCGPGGLVGAGHRDADADRLPRQSRGVPLREDHRRGGRGGAGGGAGRRPAVRRASGDRPARRAQSGPGRVGADGELLRAPAAQRRRLPGGGRRGRVRRAARALRAALGPDEGGARERTAGRSPTSTAPAGRSMSSTCGRTGCRCCT